MIRINLLPAEKRKAERTPLPRLALIMATAAVATLLILWISVILLKIKSTTEEIEEKTRELASLQPRLAEHTQLTNRRNELRAKITEIDDLSKRPMEDGWWRAVNALWDVINNHPKVWIDDLRILDERTVQGEVKRADADDKTAPPYGVTFRCHVAGSEVVEMTRFRNALKSHPVLQETLTHINMNVDWSVAEEKDFSADSIYFNISMWGAMTKPKRKVTVPAKPGAAAVSATPAPAGGAK